MSEKDGLPKTICAECAEKLDDFFNFRNMCRKIDSTFNELLHSDNNKSDSDDCSNSKTSETSKDKGEPQKITKKKIVLEKCFKVIALKFNLFISS